MFENIKKTWNNLSLTKRKSIKRSPLQVGAMLALQSLLVGTAMLNPPLLLLFAAGDVLYVGLTHLPGLIKEIKHGNDKTIWTNDLGQTIESTENQRKDLQTLQTKILFPPLLTLSDKKTPLLIEKFRPVADKVTVLYDVKNPGDGKFHFARQKTVLMPL